MEDWRTPCPKCGAVGLARNIRAFGVCREMVWPDGQQEMETSGLQFSKPRTVRCLECDEIRRDVDWPGE